jgi:sec-independent protein translocase protein TatB
MFDIAWSELLIVVIVAILVVGPKELPALLRSLGQMMGKLRRSADDFRRQFDEAVREAGAEDLQREMRALKQSNPLTQIRDQIDEVARGAAMTDQPAPKADEEASAGDDLGPPPPLPPRGAAAEGPQTSAAPAAVAEKTSAPQPSASAKEGAANGAGHEIRVNGEHRPAG